MKRKKILVTTKGYEGFDHARLRRVLEDLSPTAYMVPEDPAKTRAAATADKYFDEDGTPRKIH